MTVNPYTPDYDKKNQPEEIKWVEDQIKKLPLKIQKLIQKGQTVIEGHLKINSTRVSSLNVFNLTENIPGDVMKYLVMLYTAAGYYVSILGDSFFTQGSNRTTKYPNQITLLSKKSDC